MLYLHVSNRTENLLRHLVEVIRVGERARLFAPDYFLIQSRGMERLISQTLASSFKSWCNFTTVMPLEFLHLVAERLGHECTPDGYERNILVWRLDALLQELKGEEFQAISGYLKGDNLDLKRFQFAGKLANIFDQYQLMRPQMLSAWENGRTVTTSPAEIWQQKLWLMLGSGQSAELHRGALLQQVIQTLRSRQNLTAVLPQRLSIFGLSTMPPVFLAFFQSLALHIDVHLYLLSPCREFWADLPGRRRLLTKAMAGDNEQTAIATAEPDCHPLLVSLGSQGRDFQRLLLEKLDFELEIQSYEDPAEGSESTLLQCLQSDLLAGRCNKRAVGFSGDTSIRLVSCHSRMREMAVLKEHLLRLMFEDSSLQLRDIVVMAPDIQEYAPLIPAVFADIQHSVSDRTLKRRNPVLAAFSDFLALFRGRFGWQEVLNLLKIPVIADRLGLSQSDLEVVENWVVNSGIRWGMSAEQRQRMGLANFEESTWQAGIEQLLMGYAIDSETFVDEILPYSNIEGSMATALGGLCQFLEILEAAEKDFSRPHTLTDWSVLLKQYIERLLKNEQYESDDSRDMLELLEIVVELGEKPGQFHPKMVDFSVIHAWLEQMASETRSSSGFLRGQLTFCSMLPMRSIPFKVVCLLGLNEGTFPSTDRHATFDLMALEHRPGDRSRRIDDRYQFLETLLATREQLYLSYIGQSIKTNEEIPPSVVVTELMETLAENYGVEELTVAHPLHPFSSRYYSGEEPELFSYDSQYCEVAKRLRKPATERTSWWQGQHPGSVEKQIAIGDLLRFFSNPQRFFVRNCLGIRLAGQTETVPASESFAPHGLDRYLLEQEILECLLQGEDPHHYVKKIRARGRWPLAVPGDILYQQKLREIEHFAETIRAEGMGSPLPDIPVELEVDGKRLVGVLGNRYENGILIYRYADFRGKDLLVAWLHHQLSLLTTTEPDVTVMLTRDRRCSFSAGTGGLADLKSLLDIYVDGCRQPSPLYIEPAIAWLKRADRTDQGMLEAARKRLSSDLDNGFDRDTELLLRNSSPEMVLGPDFEQICRTVLAPIWSSADD